MRKRFLRSGFLIRLFSFWVRDFFMNLPMMKEGAPWKRIQLDVTGS